VSDFIRRPMHPGTGIYGARVKQWKKNRFYVPAMLVWHRRPRLCVSLNTSSATTVLVDDTFSLCHFERSWSACDNVVKKSRKCDWLLMPPQGTFTRQGSFQGFSRVEERLGSGYGLSHTVPRPLGEHFLHSQLKFIICVHQR
jgi:hypothetical protein